MKIFIGQAVTGENMDKLKSEINEIKPVLEGNAHSIYCAIFDDELQKKDYNLILKHAFEEIDNSDCFLAIVRGEKKSEGMLMEIGYCFAKKKKLILAVNRNVRDIALKEIVDEIIEFKDIGDLKNKLENLK